MKVAFVAPFYGASAAGGAEAECRQTAIHLAAAGAEVHVFTTCLLDQHSNWNFNYHRRGDSIEDGVAIRRFPAEQRDLAPFFRLNQRILSGEALNPQEQKEYLCLNVNSGALYRALAAERDAFDAFCLIPYLFGTTWFAARICGAKSVLIPCLHDEPYARLDIFGELFANAGRCVFHSRAEQTLAAGLYGDGVSGKGVLLGEGVDTEFTSDGARFRRRYGVEAPFLLYAGKKDATKNVDTLIRYFSFYRQRRTDSGLKLVMIGPGRLPVPEGMEDHILDLGFVPEQDKRDAYAAAAVFCQPSLNESFSIVIMEAWICGRPCLVHAGCAVTREHAVASGGGLFFANYGEFEGCLDRLLSDPGESARMGAAGRDYVREHFAWDRIVRRWRDEVFRG